MWKHCQVVHKAEKVDFMIETTGRFECCEERQTDKGSRVKVQGFKVKHLMNSKSEFNQPPIIRIATESGNVQETQGGGPAMQGGQLGRGRGVRGRARGRGRRPGRGATQIQS
jgi:hypothetical protein